MGAKKKISKHPNPYILAEEIKIQIKEGSDTAVAETLTSHNKKVDPRLETLKKRKKGLMKDLSKRNVDLEMYLVSMGANTIKYQPTILIDPDPLADLGNSSEESDEDEDLGLGSADVSLDDTGVDHVGLFPPVPSQCPPLAPLVPSSLPHVPRRPAAKTAHNQKGKRKKQKPVSNSEDSFLHIESLADIDGPVHASIGGSELRELRRQADDVTEDSTNSTAFTAAVLASAGMTVLSRFVSRSSASRSSPRRSSVGRRPSINPRSFSNSPVRTNLISCNESTVNPDSSAKERVASLGFRFSSSQPYTQGDGNCMLYAIWDQLKKCNHNILQTLKTPHELRLHICSKLKHQLEENHIFWVQTFTPETWLHKMIKDKTWCDDAFLQITANIFNKNIIFIPLSPSSAHHAGMYLDVRSTHGGHGDPFFMLYFEEWKMAGHYQSLEPDPVVRNNKAIAHFNWRSKSFASTSMNSILSEASCPSATMCPPPPPPVPSHPPAPMMPTTNAQLQSTRQRIESEGSLSFMEILSPIGSRKGQPRENEPNQTGL